MCVLGTFVGGLLWFLLLSYLVAKGHGKFSTGALVRMAHISGAILLAAGIVIGVRLVHLISKHHRHRRGDALTEEQASARGAHPFVRRVSWRDHSPS